jgi:hypothetical protein
MRNILLFVFTLIAIQGYAQNPFLDGIHASDVVEFKDGDIQFSALEFKVETDNCKATYIATEYKFNQELHSNITRKTSWNWKDIASVEMDTIRNIMRLNGRDSMPCTEENLDTKEGTSNPNNNMVNIYFKTRDLAANACKWVLTKVGTCGGKVKLIN